MIQVKVLFHAGFISSNTSIFLDLEIMKFIGILWWDDSLSYSIFKVNALFKITILTPSNYFAFYRILILRYYIPYNYKCPFHSFKFFIANFFYSSVISNIYSNGLPSAT